MPVDASTFQVLWPEIILAGMATWIYVGGAFAREWAWWRVIALASFAAAGVSLYWQVELLQGGIASGPLSIDALSLVVRWAALAGGFIFTLIAWRSPPRELAPEFIGTLMLVVCGVMIVASARDIVLLFLGLELISIPTYVLLFLGRRDRASAEATGKYFFLSIMSSALLLYGLSFLYGLGGSTDLGAFAAASAAGEKSFGALAPIALLLIVAGLGFKMAAAPFHFYAPDVYQGTTNVNAAILAVAPKAAGLVALIKIVVLAMPGYDFAWQLLLVLALVTMTLGNVCALWQTNFRRLMAYSSIAHSGYMLIGVAAALAGGLEAGGISATLLYLLFYALASIGAFAAAAWLGDVSNVEQLAGAGRSRPAAGGALAVCMFSLAGIPPLAGFWGKLGLFFAAVQIAGGHENVAVRTWFTVLAVVGVLNAAIAAAYYLRVVAVVYFRPAAERPLPLSGGFGAAAGMAVCTALVVAFGIAPRFPLFYTNLAELEARRSAAYSRYSFSSHEPEVRGGAVTATAGPPAGGD